MTSCWQAKTEDLDGNAAMHQLSPATAALLESLPDTPASLALKSEYLAKANELRRGEYGNFMSKVRFLYLV